MNKIKENDIILIHTPRKRYITRVESGKSFSTHVGNILLKDLVGLEYGSAFESYFIYRPDLNDIILHGLKRKTQVIYPKEAGYIVTKLNLKNGSKVFECGTGNGALSLFFLRAIGPDGMLYTYEKEEEFHLNAKKNIEMFGQFQNVKMFRQEIGQGIEEKDFDAAFLDFRDSCQYLPLMKSILKPGAPLGMIMPTTNQISLAIRVLERYFKDIEIIEIMLRKYKANPDRLRPEDIMVGHTGYLVFAR
ncbi:MAG: methyltransferase domain-containing protein [bacterium]|nr:methyltransferase domain-containing protein [bacterium]